MAKHLLPTTCFETAFIEYLRLRFEFEPLMHYAMAALHVCDQTSREYPDFVKGFLAWFAPSFLFDHKGGFPAQGHAANPASARWSRYEDCHDLLEGWLNDDLDAALVRQETTLIIVEEVEIKMTEDREDESAEGRKRAMRKKPKGVIYGEIADDLGISPDTVKRRYERATKMPEDFLSHIQPVALLRTDGQYTIETREVGRPGEIRFRPGKKLR
ncbi:sigma-70 family RNA polymerase sigma factor [Roseobacter weihaiensis]|uniref:hypothetical protein n=1 Tax=Roseobacter weihaiensis TaxID=2763262 RepID=UPI001D09B366|nr:hypothetical protein [Roseobacter sp. H9]